MGPATRAGPTVAVAGVGRVCSAARAWCWAGAVTPLAAGLIQMRWVQVLTSGAIQAALVAR